MWSYNTRYSQLYLTLFLLRTHNGHFAFLQEQVSVVFTGEFLKTQTDFYNTFTL